MTISMVVAMDQHRLIGRENDLPWYLPADLAHFKKLTLGKRVLMGRKTFESIVNRLDKPLPDRESIVLTRDKGFAYQGVQVLHNLECIADMVQDDGELMVIGGTQIFEALLSQTQTLYVTWIEHVFDGDAYFPEWDATEWELISEEAHQPDERNLHPYRFCHYQRVIVNRVR